MLCEEEEECVRGSPLVLEWEGVSARECARPSSAETSSVATERERDLASCAEVSV